MKIDLSRFVGKKVEATLQNGEKIVGEVTYIPQYSSSSSELEYRIGPEVYDIFTVDGFYWTTRSPASNNIIKIKPMKKYQQLEQQVKELQKEIERLKKEEEQENKLPKDFKLDPALSFLDCPTTWELSNMFDWDKSPQGFRFWHIILDNLEQDSDYKVPDEAIIQIQKWVIEFYRNKGGQ
jgi:hypothetical protein